MTSPAQPPARFAYGRLGGRLALGVIAVGLVLIGLGYNGMAGNLVIAAQLPYLVSGGLFGVALVTIGAAFMISQSAREDRQRLEALLQQLVDAVGGEGAGHVPSDAEGLFAAGTNSFHRPSCRLVDGREEISFVTEQEAVAQGLQPCRVCHPVATAGSVTVR